MATLAAVWWLVIHFSVEGGIKALPYPDQGKCQEAAKYLEGQGAFGGKGSTCIPGYVLERPE